MNEINKELFDKFVRGYNADGGSKPTETAVTNLIHHAVTNKSYRIFNGNGEDVDGKEIDLYDVVMCSTFANDVYFMICVDIDSNDLVLCGCNSEGKLTQKVV